MGTFYKWIEVGSLVAGEFQWVNALVDTGAAHSMIPASLLTQTLDLSPAREREFILADGSKQNYGLGEARFKVEDEELSCPVIFGPEGKYLIGATTLQIFNLIADTTLHRLIPTPELTL